METLKGKNETIKSLKQALRQYPRQSVMELDNILSDVKDKQSFIFLLDSHETEKEITRDILERFIDYTVDMNEEFIDFLEKNHSIGMWFDKFFSLSNWKGIIILVLSIGMILSITFNKEVAIKALDIFSSKVSSK